MTIDGRLVLENDSAPSPADRVQVQLRKIQGDVGTLSMGMLSSLSTPLDPDGSFHFNNVLTGNYRVSISTAEKRFYLKKALLGSTNVLDQSLQVSIPMPASPLNLVLSSNIGQVQGLVLDRTQQPLPGAQVVLIPTADRNRVELYGTATTDEDGRFTISAVSPGEYRLFAWKTLEKYSYFDPQLIQSSMPLSQLVRVGESETVDVRIQAE